MTFSRTFSRAAAVWALALLAAIPSHSADALIDPGRAAAVSPVQPKEQSAPAGMILYFEREGCPPGWTLANIARGRVIVSTANRNEVGVTVNEPMNNRTAPTHSHPYTVSLGLASKSISAANGGSNTSGAKAQTVRLNASTQPSDGGLPWRQMMICREQ